MGNIWVKLALITHSLPGIQMFFCKIKVAEKIKQLCAFMCDSNIWSFKKATNFVFTLLKL